MSRPIISGRYALGPFRDAFGHCGATADLFAQVTANAQGSVKLPVDLLASAVNELLEWSFACPAVTDNGHLLLEVIEEGQRLRLLLSLPVDAELAADTTRRLQPVSAEQARDALLALVEHDRADAQRWLGLHWLQAEFGPLHAGVEDGLLTLQLELQP
ncbi:MAG: hypothetical protein KDI56_07950 [Xanthomonadales bacterium]|nr:hypothetical protein [Xanthomonadales bacterium]